MIFIDPKAGPTLGDVIDLPWPYWLVLAVWAVFCIWMVA